MQEEVTSINSVSPSVRNNKQETFFRALGMALEGKKVRSQSWPEGFYIFFNGDVLTLHKDDNTDHNLIVSKADFDLTDWVSL